MKNKTALILYILILVFAFVLEIVCICQSQETMDLDSGEAGLYSIFYGCTVQSNVGVLVFSAMCDVVVLYNGQNSKTV